VINLVVKRQADVQAVKEALNSAVDVLNAVEGSVHFLLPKVRFSCRELEACCARLCGCVLNNHLWVEMDR
jgi:hypothetical protein